MMVERLKHEGSLHSSSYLLKICVKMMASWSAQDFRQADVTQSGPGALIYNIIYSTSRKFGLFYIYENKSMAIIKRITLNYGNDIVTKEN